MSEAARTKGRRDGAPRRDRTFAVAAILLGLAGSLLGGEVVVRLVAPQTIKPTLFAFDPQVGHRLRANASARHRTRTGEYDVRVSTNSLGWRSNEPDGRPTVVVLGDSFTFGVGVDQTETFVSLLERSLWNGSHRYQVVNWGVEGRTPDQYWADYHYGKRVVEPSLVVVGFYEQNDFIDRSSLISFDTNGGARFHALQEATGLYGALRSSIQGPIYDWFAQHSHLATLLKNTLYLLLARETGDETRRDPHGAYTLSIIRGLYEEAKADGVPVGVVIIPHSPHASERTNVTRTNQLVIELGAHGIPVLDLRPMMGGRGELYYSVDDFHWNARGHAEAAAHIRSFIEERRLLHP